MVPHILPVPGPCAVTWAILQILLDFYSFSGVSKSFLGFLQIFFCRF